MNVELLIDSFLWLKRTLSTWGTSYQSSWSKASLSVTPVYGQRVMWLAGHVRTQHSHTHTHNERTHTQTVDAWTHTNRRWNIDTTLLPLLCSRQHNHSNHHSYDALIRIHTSSHTNANLSPQRQTPPSPIYDGIYKSTDLIFHQPSIDFAMTMILSWALKPTSSSLIGV